MGLLIFCSANECCRCLAGADARTLPWLNSYMDRLAASFENDLRNIVGWLAWQEKPDEWSDRCPPHFQRVSPRRARSPAPRARAHRRLPPRWITEGARCRAAPRSACAGHLVAHAA
jgi:hypothetical protein